MATETGERAGRGEPKTPLARRLEHIRGLLGFQNKSLRKFWEALEFETSGAHEGFGSYSAAAQYHNGEPRDAPLGYLVRICQKFPQVNLEWLAMERGAPINQAQVSAAAAQRATGYDGAVEILEAALGLDMARDVRPAAALWGMLHSIEAAVLGIDRPQTLAQKREITAALARSLAVVLMAPQRELGLLPKTKAEWSNYMEAIALALRQLTDANRKTPDEMLASGQGERFELRAHERTRHESKGLFIQDRSPCTLSQGVGATPMAD